MRPVPAVAMIALLSGTFLAACNHTPDPIRLAAVERMIDQTEKMTAEMNDQDTNALRHMVSLFEAERPAIEQRFRDTLLPREAEVLGNYYRAMGERLPAVLAQRRTQQARLDSAAKRLRDLRHDMEHGLMGPNKCEQALAAEQQWQTRLRQDQDSIIRRTDVLRQERRTYRQAIDSQLHP